MFKYLSKIKNKIKTFDKVAKNPFVQAEHSYNPCQNCITQTYVWIEEDIKNNVFGRNCISNPIKK